jgi:sugar transferase (PEP-CTERM/EpsH1 system associated)
MRNLLFLSHRVPYPPDKGDKIRAWHIFRHLARSFRIHLGCFVDDPADADRLEELRPLCADLACIPLDRRRQRLKALLRARPGRPLTLGYFQDHRLARWIDAKLAGGQIDVLFAYSTAIAHYAMRANVPVRVLDLVDVDSSKWTAYASNASWLVRRVFAREGRTLLAFERKAVSRFTYSFFVSEAEWRHFITLAPEAAPHSGWIENGVDLAFFSPDQRFDDPFPATAPATARLAFTGRMDYQPNIDAVTWFASAVLPLLRRQRPDILFAVVGAEPTAQVRGLASLPGVLVTGRVPDIRPWLRHASAVVAPLLIGRGIQNKVLEAMAMARPVIATPEAFEGVRAVPEQDILIASGAQAMAARIDDVLAGRHQGLGHAARQAVETNHDWSASLARLDTLFGIAPGPAAGPVIGPVDASQSPPLCRVA